MVDEERMELIKQMTTVRETIATVVQQNKNQNELLSDMKDKLEKHEEVSDIYRKKTLANEICIRAVKHNIIPTVWRAVYGLYGAIGLIIVGVAIAFFTK